MQCFKISKQSVWHLRGFSIFNLRAVTFLFTGYLFIGGILNNIYIKDLNVL